jgi:hypothetical protein
MNSYRVPFRRSTMPRKNSRPHSRPTLLPQKGIPPTRLLHQEMIRPQELLIPLPPTRLHLLILRHPQFLSRIRPLSRLLRKQSLSTRSNFSA